MSQLAEGYKSDKLEEKSVNFESSENEDPSRQVQIKRYLAVMRYLAKKEKRLEYFNRPKKVKEVIKAEKDIIRKNVAECRIRIGGKFLSKED